MAFDEVHQEVLPEPPRQRPSDAPEGYVPYGTESPARPVSRIYAVLAVLCAFRAMQAACQLIYTAQIHEDSVPMWELYSWFGATCLLVLYGVAAAVYWHESRGAIVFSVLADLYVAVMLTRSWFEVRDGTGANVALVAILLLPLISLGLTALLLGSGASRAKWRARREAIRGNPWGDDPWDDL